jgi:hypothetical protein
MRKKSTPKGGSKNFAYVSPGRKFRMKYGESWYKDMPNTTRFYKERARRRMGDMLKRMRK